MNDRVQFTQRQVREKLAEMNEKKHGLSFRHRLVAEALDKAARLAMKYFPEAFKEESDDDENDKKKEDEKTAEKPAEKTDDKKKTLTEQEFEEISK